MLPVYAAMSSDSPEVIQEVIVYGRIVCVASVGLFCESVWTKVLQAEGDMKTPMLAQIAGALTNIVLDPILISGWGVPAMGIAGAAIATVAGQMVAAVIVLPRGYRRSPARREYPGYLKLIYRLGTPNILMQLAYTFYILGLNLILSGFSDQAVTALGLYYKWQTFFSSRWGRCKPVSCRSSATTTPPDGWIGCDRRWRCPCCLDRHSWRWETLCFEVLPAPMLRVFTADPVVIRIGTYGFRWTGPSFLPMVTSLLFPVFFQAVGQALKSSLLTVIRTVVLFVPLGYIFSHFGLHRFWLTFCVPRC